MKIISKYIGRLALAASLVFAHQASASVLPVPYYAQRSFFAAADTNHLHNISDWCWDASSEMVLDTPLSASYPGTFFDQDTIAAYGSQGSNHWNYLYGSAARYTDTAGVTHPALNGIDLILKNFGSLSTKSFGRVLTRAELQNEIDAGRPAVARLGWSTSAASYVAGNSGHFVVLYGFDGTVVDINDPWPDSGPVMQTYTSFATPTGTNTYIANSAYFRWTHTLTLGASLDVCFLIDSTGSMGSTIASVKTALTAISSNIFALFPDARIAVKDFKDNPAYADGDSAYLDQVDAPLTTNRTTILAALNGISADGGGDIPEAHWTSLIRTMNGDVGNWRTNPTPRIIIIASDTHGHDPVEPWAGGFSLGDVIAKATIPGKEFSIYGLAASSDAFADFTTLADGTGGAEFDTGYTGVADGILQVISQTAQSTRRPQGTSVAPRPTFMFQVGQVGMSGLPLGYVIQILKSNVLTGNWDKYLESPITGSTFTPGSSLPLGDYRWRLGAREPATTLKSPAGDVLDVVPAALVYENSFTSFTRRAVTAGAATMVSPTTDSEETFTLLNGNIPHNLLKLALVGRLPQPFVWQSGLFATAYQITIEIQNPGTHAWSVFKTVNVTPATTVSGQTLTVSVLGLKPNNNYRWSITSSN